MTKEQIIEIAHDVQDDAGSFDSFNQSVNAYRKTEIRFADPVAAFIGALLETESDADDCLYNIDFYISELNKVIEGIKIENQ